MIWLLIACVPSYEDAPSVAAETYCGYAEDECGLLQEGEYEDCVNGNTDLFEILWPSEQCADGFDREAWGICHDALQSWDCDDWLGSLSDVGSVCGSSAICL